MQVPDTNNYVTADGTIHHNSGKSVTCCMEIFSRAQEQWPSAVDGRRKTRWAVIRNSYGELRSTTQKTWTDWFPEEVFGPIRRGSGPDTHLIRHGEVELEVLFLAMDRDEDVRKLLSLEITGGWINEAREVRWAIMEGLMARVGRYPARRDGGPLWHGIIMDTNPPNTRHWWYEQFEVKRPQGWQVFKQPSGRSEGAENVENLPANYYVNMMKGMDELSIRCHVDGEYSFLRTGQPVYPQFQHSLHVAREVLNPTPEFPIVCAIDVGRSPGVVFAQQSYGGRINVINELHSVDTSAQTLADLIKRMVNTQYPRPFRVEMCADPAFTQRSQSRDESVSDIFFAAGLDVYPACRSNDSVDLRTDAVRTLLQTLDPTGKAMLMISPNCTHLIEAMVGGYSYKEHAMGGGITKEIPDKGPFSHIANALEFLCLYMGASPATAHPKADYTPPKVTGVTARERYY